jgi:hypothetical protein
MLQPNGNRPTYIPASQTIKEMNEKHNAKSLKISDKKIKKYCDSYKGGKSV